MMTAIAAVLVDGQITMGGDSAGVCSDFTLTVRKDEKVFTNGPFLIGGTTSFRMLSLLRYSFKPPEQQVGIDDVAYMNTDFISELRKCFVDNGFGDGKTGGKFLIGYKKGLYIIEDDFQVGIPLHPFAACGCGSDICIGSMYATKSMEPRKRIKTALQAAEQFSGGVRGPFVIKTI